MTAYYNEIDPYAAQWLRNLIAAGHIAAGDVDERDIRTVQPGDLRGYTQCHFFAGIGGWSLALRLAGWSDDRPVWTGSCPCQSFSAAGANLGGDDPRHLWPAWFRLIRECRPNTIFGEQVEAAITHGWFDLVCDDLEREGYAAGATGLPASVVAFHTRQRLFWLADTPGERQPERSEQFRQLSPKPEVLAGSEWLLCRDGKRRPAEPGTFPLAHGIPNRVGRLRAYGNAIVPQVAAEFIAAYMEAV